MPTYKVRDKTVEVSGVNNAGEEVHISFSKGSVTTKKDDEIAILDALATDPASPIAFDQKEE